MSLVQQVTWHIVQWDYQQQPEWDEIQQAISCYDHPRLTLIDGTGDAHNAILVSGLTFTTAEAREAYEVWCQQRGTSR